jgi:hypothetical protein
MSKEINEKKINNLIHTLGLLNNLQDEEIRLIVESQFRFTYETIKNLNFENLSNEEIDDLKKVFYYKYIGKIYTDSEIIQKHNNRSKYINKQEEDD